MDQWRSPYICLPPTPDFVFVQPWLEPLSAGLRFFFLMMFCFKVD